MRQKLRSVLCLFALLLVLLPVSARANGLPTSSIYISIAGMNDGIVSVALLGNEPYDNPPQNPPEALTAALPDGWYVWDYAPYNSEQVFLWTIPFPSPFRAALLHEDGTVLLTGEAERTRAMQTFTINAQTGEISTSPIGIGLLKQFVCTFMVTLLIEAAVLLLFRFKLYENLKPFLLVNLATQTLMTLTYGRILLSADWRQAFFWAFAVEAVIFVVEVLAYARFLRGHTRARRVAYAITANLVSFVIGTLFITPVYSALAHLMY
ncbi:hypothetical protein [Agathobaculum sp. Marseille-P7918]|uniref:hypothetical protein n=1 Tax=Agathobaculum sp. Marseille-P7918 TaxID=2479843 RepID=UPI00356783F3